jgi:hypothetical protein
VCGALVHPTRVSQVVGRRFAYAFMEGRRIGIQAAKSMAERRPLRELELQRPPRFCYACGRSCDPYSGLRVCAACGWATNNSLEAL